jgi:hypothetical protein
VEHLIWLATFAEHLIVPATFLLGFSIFIGCFRKSVSKLLSSARMSKLWGAEFAEQTTQQQKEVEIKVTREPPAALPPPAVITDPVLSPQVELLRKELDERSKDAKQREELLLLSVAQWQLNHKNARTARFIFGSQIDLLQELNSKSQGETIDALKKHYDSAVQSKPEAYERYSYDEYLLFLQNSGLVTKIGDRLSITPEGKAFLAYRVFFGDTMKKDL